MDQPDSEIYYKANEDVSACLTGDEKAVLYHPDTSREKVVNPTGLFIWQRLDGSVSVKEIADKLLRCFASAPHGQVMEDVTFFLEDLTRQGFVNTFNDRLPPSRRAKGYPNINDRPQSVDISLTGKCNLRCQYCFYADEMQSRQDLPVQQWLSFFKELGQLGVHDVCLSGGEIFTRSDLWDLIDSIIANRMRYSILTNGTLITEKTLDLFRKEKRRTRLNSIQVSIDGSCPDIHDKSRGKGSFNKAVRGLRLIKEAGLPGTSRVTVNRYNVDDLENIAQLLLDHIGLQSFTTNDAMPMGAGCHNQHTITLQPGQQLKVMKSLASLAERYDGRVQAMAGPLAKWRSYKEMEHARATGEKTTRWEMGYLTACGCVFSKLAVHHDGVISPCNMLSGLELGKINTNSIKKIWKTHPTLRALKERRQIPMNQVAGCEDCEWTPYCNGSCPGLAYEMTGDFNRANPHDCYALFLEATGGGKI
ncbi:MAG: SynChlorMet cassette radical SAM/SPASM protein ScmE [Deltaproteobacteria bacterium]|nr:SynChlorMet cassette radical SAM/SPASM protein ScmE [Deltaproteobacteria bacterium]